MIGQELRVLYMMTTGWQPDWS